MTRRNMVALVSAVTLALLAAGGIIAYRARRKPVTIRGAVLRADPDPNRQLPLADVQITAINALGSGAAKSDSAGFFSLLLQLRRENYRPLDVDDFIGDKIYVEHMVPVHQQTPAEIRVGSPISNTRIRYSTKATTEANIGSAVRTFEIINRGNILCKKRAPCSPDGEWKASVGSLSLDAGEGNEFRNARVSCIAGPCPFTKILTEGFSQDRRHFNVSALNWSDTVTFLLEAEVVHPMTSDLVRETYPVIFGRALNFSLPASAEGPSIEADVSGEPIVFPLGPDLFLRWADCSMVVDRDQSRNYRCELKPGYQFH
jgi:hypothetical protein